MSKLDLIAECKKYDIKIVSNENKIDLKKKLLCQHYNLTRTQAKLYSKGISMQLMKYNYANYKNSKCMKQYYLSRMDEIDYWRQIPSIIDNGKIYYLAEPGKQGNHTTKIYSYHICIMIDMDVHMYIFVF
jgi:hypothetical protein